MASPGVSGGYFDGTTRKIAVIPVFLPNFRASWFDGCALLG
jgi:hypothetical protein